MTATRKTAGTGAVVIGVDVTLVTAHTDDVWQAPARTCLAVAITCRSRHAGAVTICKQTQRSYIQIVYVVPTRFH